MQITVKTYKGEEVPYEIETSDKLEVLQALIYDKQGITAKKQLLIFAGRTMRDPSKTLAEYNVQNDSTLNLFIDEQGNDQLFIKCLNGKTITIDCNVYIDTVGKIKAIIEAKEGIEIDRQKLVFAGKELQDNKTLDSCNYRKDSSLHLVVRHDGG